VKFTLTEPTQLNGKEYTEIVCDIEKLKAKDLKEILAAFRQLYRGEVIAVPNMDDRYLIMVAAASARMNPADFDELWAQDYVAITTNVRNFLLEKV